VPNTEPEKYSGLAVDDQGRVTGVVRRGSSQQSHHFFGVQVVEADVFATVPDGVPYETVAALYPALIARQPESVRAFHARAEYLDIGTPADYLDTSLLVARREGWNASSVPTARVDASARVERSILWDDVVVEAGAMLKECIVTDGVCVPADTSWHGVTLRIADGERAPGEKRIGDLLVASL
jgi:NDP-sugar pyrophosphorylase family protein